MGTRLAMAAAMGTRLAMAAAMLAMSAGVHEASGGSAPGTDPPTFASESPIPPTIGRVVLYRHVPNGKQYPADVTTVWGNNCVNLSIKNDASTPIDDVSPSGPIISQTSVLYNEDPAVGRSWSWMPYQKGQAAKTDELTPKVAALEAECKEQRARADELERKLIEDRPEATVPKGLIDEMTGMQAQLGKLYACLRELLAHADAGTVERCDKILA